MKFKPYNNEVLYASGEAVTVDLKDVAELKNGARLQPRRRMRVCTHPEVNDKLHEMIIVHEKGIYVRPHKHLDKSESLYVVEGSVDVILFDDAGHITRVIEMGEYKSGKTFYYRLQAPIYHSLLIRSEVLVFHEITNGPFIQGTTVFPEWAPENDAMAEKAGFVSDLERKTDAFLRQRKSS